MTQTEQPPASPALILQITQLMSGHALPRAILTAVHLHLDDHLRGGPRSAADLARVTATDPDVLYRLLRALAALGMFVESEDGTFALTPLGEHLRFAQVGMLGEEAQRAWAGLPETLKSGRPAFEQIYGSSFYEYFAQRPEKEALFNVWNTATGSAWLPPAVAACDFSDAETVVDVGGGQGVFLAAILQANPSLRGVLLDLPEAVAGAPALFEAAGVADRCRVVPGNFLDAVPAGGDVYTVSRVLFNWSDERATAILRNVRGAMAEGGRLLVIESPLRPLGDPRRAQGAFNDLNLLLLMGGRQRTEDGMAALLDAADFALTGIRPVDDVWSVFEGRPV